VLAEMARVETAFAVLAVTVLACVLGAAVDGSDHRYKEGDRVPLYANKVGPFHNPRYSDNSLAMRSKLFAVHVWVRCLYGDPRVRAWFPVCAGKYGSVRMALLLNVRITIVGFVDARRGRGATEQD
jgi:hypothetical protein